MKSKTGSIFNIQRFSVHDGPGIRTTVFFKGCPLSCWWCHNPECRSEFNIPQNNRFNKKFATGELLAEIKRDRIFYEESGGGVTFSGGEPLMQPAFLKTMLVLCKEEGLHTAVDTSGFGNQEDFRILAKNAELWLFDLKIMNSAEHLKYTGVGNKIILSNLELLLSEQVNLIIRIPLIPGITATSENIQKIVVFLSSFSHKPKVNLLPFHRIADGKYEKLGLQNKMLKTPGNSQKDSEKLKDIFLAGGFDCEINA